MEKLGATTCPVPPASNIRSAKLMRTSRSMTDQHELEERVKTAQAECERLREENVRLRAMLSIHDPVLEHPAPSAPVSAPTPLPCSSITEDSTSEQKIALFRGLFRGREDVYAVRWEGKGGKAGYSPAGVMDWQAIHTQLDRKNERKLPAKRGCSCPSRMTPFEITWKHPCPASQDRAGSGRRHSCGEARRPRPDPSWT
jgi:TOTE conflict system primase-like protein